MAARIERYRVEAGLAQYFPGSLPGMPRLAAPVLEDDGGARRVAPRVPRDAKTLVTGPYMPWGGSVG